MKKIALLLSLLSCTTAFGQLFTPAYEQFSTQETAYIYLADGNTLEGTVSSVNQKNGLIQSLVLKPSGESKKTKVKAESITAMYLPISQFNKINNAINLTFDPRKWRGKGVNNEVIQQGYAYFEKTSVANHAKTDQLLLQLVNPTFSEKIKVFHNPLGVSTRTMEFKNGFAIEDEVNKSYYVKIGDAAAVKLRKKDYEEAYAVLYKDCPQLVDKLKGNHSWIKFDEHLHAYTKGCN
ncbi:hypothetical protein [Emticicia fluvialis]|uniref:hypothetical protein n=1 Tax=Emticicia fluvialis TaxID=2974474 RepID=UPI002165B39C|nr:hypothetical protein [Emticicia fluvialis]